MLSLLSFRTPSRAKMGGIVLDLLVSEELTLEGEVTEYAVEDGTTISDHITRKAERLRITGTMAVTDAAAFTLLNKAQKFVDVIEMLRAMHKGRALVEVSTGRMIYKEMAFQSLVATRSNDGPGGNIITIAAELKQVRKVRLKTASVPAARATAPASGRAGATNTAAGRTASSSSQAATSTANTMGPPRPERSAINSLRYSTAGQAGIAGVRDATSSAIDWVKGITGYGAAR